MPASVGIRRRRPSTGEISSIYLVPEVWGTGLGRALMQTCVDRLAEDGHHEAVLWVLVTNSQGPPLLRGGGLGL